MEELANRIHGLTSLSELERLQPRVEGNNILKIVFNAKKNELNAKKNELNAKKNELVANAKLRGSYYVSADELWRIEREVLMPDTERLSGYFDEIARSTRPSCYASSHVYQPTNKSTNLPDFHDASVGTNSNIDLQQFDVLGNPFNKQRAHNAPDSIKCLPSWGHAGEGCLGEIKGKRKNRKRLLLVMGTKSENGKNGFRYSPFNFIRFSAHDEYYDKAPHVLFLPTMAVSQIKAWNGTPYDVLVIACDFEDKTAADVYKGIIRNHNMEEGTSDEIDTATTSLQAFMKGLAASLLSNIPIQLAEAASTGKEVELQEAQRDIVADGLKLPFFDRNREIRPVCKLRFDYEHNGSVADPWMLLTKASVNLSWKLGQKLLPACKPPAATSEGDCMFWQNMAEFQAAQGESVVPPAEVTVAMPQNAAVAEGVGATNQEVVPVVTPEKKGDNWEYLT